MDSTTIQASLSAMSQWSWALGRWELKGSANKDRLLSLSLTSRTEAH